MFQVYFCNYVNYWAHNHYSYNEAISCSRVVDSRRLEERRKCLLHQFHGKIHLLLHHLELCKTNDAFYDDIDNYECLGY